MTLHLYAKRKKWALKTVRVTLAHEHVHAKDGEHCDEDEPKNLQTLSRSIELVGDLDAEQIARLGEIADKCPVHRTLLGPLKIPTKVAQADG